MRKIVALLLIFALSLFVGVRVSRADEIADLQNQINDLQKQLDASKAATTPLESEVKSLESQLGVLSGKIVSISADLVKSEEVVAQEKMQLASTVRNFYMRSFVDIPLLTIFSTSDATDTLKLIAYQQTSSKGDKEVIESVSAKIAKLADDKKRLGLAKAQIDKQRQSLKGEIANAKSFQSELTGKIAALSARQQEILSEKSGTFQTTVGDVPLADDVASRPDYNPGFSPAFAAFSFGAPHFKGMSQYGALGRAKQGQNYEQILKAYYGGGIEIKDHNPDAQIVVEGHGTYSLEEYAKRIYEMPGSWGDEGGMEALKAQAVAARSYALARGGSICATEACQVFKPSPKGGKWEQAVNDTRGKVVYANGGAFSTLYASTSGGYQESYSSNGYSTPGFWDTPSGRGGWTSGAYEKTAGSPWFYKGWYRNRSGDSCGRSHPWLTSEEMADILNGWVVLFQGGGDSSRVTPLGSCWGGNPYSIGDLRSIGNFTSVSGVNVTYSDGGTTATVTFQTNKGSTAINGNDFYKAFNLRAPAKIALKSGLFNIEKK
ncbi:MAG: SpoIID/LytB domain-containing protein [Patescibacteria group bacterium]